MTYRYEDEGPHHKGVALLLWLSCIFGFFGIHRFYLGRPWTGALWLFTFGLLGVGQLIDLFRIPALVAEENARIAALGAPRAQAFLKPAPPRQARSARKAPESLEVQLTRAAAGRGGKLSVTQGVLATGRPFKEVEEALDAMLKGGYVDIDNDEESGTVLYTFEV